MLTLLEIQRPEDKSELLETFQPNSQTWLVSDLRTKFEIQKIVLKKQSYFEDLSVYRASELWRLLLKKTQPDLKWVSQDMVRAFVREWMEKKQDLKVGQGSDQVVADFLDLFVSVFSHPQGPLLLQNWWKENISSYQRWGGWAELAFEAYQELQKKKWTSASWASSLLQGENEFEKFWSRPLIIDLGSQFKRSEVELVQKLSRFNDVTVLVPKPLWQKDFSYLLKGYEDLAALGKSQSKESTKEQTGPQLRKYSGVLGEVKGAISQIREWLEAGVEAKCISLLMADVEAYWPLLSPILREEGIPVQKDLAIRFQTFPVILSWLAQMRLQSQKVSFADLEQVHFQDDSRSISYDQFFSLFSLLLDPEDLKRDPAIWKSYQGAMSASEVLTRDQFIGWSLKSWRKWDQTQGLEVILREILGQVGPEENLKLSSWIYLIEQIVAKKETKYDRGLAQGIQVDGLASGDSLTVSHRIFMGCSEEQLKGRGNRWLDASEVNSFAANTGFFLEHPEVSTDEFDLRWLLENSSKETILSYPATGFTGQAESPHPIWIAHRKDNEVVSVSAVKDLRWDQKQHLVPFAEVAPSTDRVSFEKLPTLSPSSLENYHQCPFIFTAKKLFKLEDLPQVDLDLDVRKRGTLDHALLEQITEEPLRFDWSDDEIQEILNRLRAELQLPIHEDSTWKAISHQKKKMVQRFLLFEKERRSLYPQIQIVAREKDFEVRLSAETLNKGNDFIFKGKIDRIDSDLRGNLLVYDYKSSMGSLKNSESWIRDNQLQLGLYSFVIEKGFLEEFTENEVISALYYTLKEMKTDRGFRISDLPEPIFEKDRKRNWLTGAQKSDLMNDFEVLLKSILVRMRAGEIQPNPLDVSICSSCEWRDLCRAPHLK